MKRPVSLLCSLSVAAALVLLPAASRAAPRGAVPVQDDDIDLDDILVDDDLDDAPKSKPKSKPANKPAPEPADDDDMPMGDADMPAGDFDLEAEDLPLDEPEPEPVPKPVTKTKPATTPPEAPKRQVAEEPSSSSRRMLLDDDEEPAEPARQVPVITEEHLTVGSEEPDESDGDTFVWVITGVGTAVGVAALAGLGVGGFLLLGNLGAPTGSVTVTPH